ncbi:MAG: exosortase/archaeosortase family protein [Limisphaerales bacterium]
MNGAKTDEIQAGEMPQPNWWMDTVDCWRRLPEKAFFFALLIAWLALFQFWGNSILGYIHTSSLFGWLNEAYNSAQNVEDSGHGDFIPFLVVGLFWWKRKELLGLPLKIWWPAIFIVATALVLHILGFLVQQPLLSVVALFAGIYGLMGLAWGRAWLRHSMYPYFLFAFSIPLAGHLSLILFPLRLFVCWLVEMVSHLLGIEVIRQGTQLMDPSGSFQYEVAAACGGMRSLVAIFLLATIYGFAVFRSAGKRIFMMALALPFAILGNLLRLLAIIIAAACGGQKWGDYVHEGGPLGIISLLPYVPAIAGLLFVGNLMEKRQAKSESAKKERA